jgi:hypothetical protein
MPSRAAIQYRSKTVRLAEHMHHKNAPMIAVDRHDHRNHLFMLIIMAWHAACTRLTERELGTAQVHR